MKKVSFLASFVLTAVLVLSTALCSAQDSIQYQLVIRNAAGQLITNKQVNMKFSLTGGGQSFYEETQKTTTDKYGNISVFIGTGTAVKGAMKDVLWSTMDISLKVESDTDGGDKFKELGTVPIAAAPYAMYAATAGSNANGGSPKDGEALFEVCDRDGQPVFAVYNSGIVVYVDESAPKAKRSGLVVTGRKASKDGEPADYFAVTTEGTHIYVDDADETAKPKRSGLIVVGRTASKDNTNNYFAVDAEGTHVFVDSASDDKAKRSGLVVTGRKASKDGDAAKFLTIDANSTQIYIDDTSSDKAKRSGLIVTGRPASKDSESFENDYFTVTVDGTRVIVDTLAVGGDTKAKRSGLVVTGRTATKEGSDVFTVDGNLTTVYVDDSDDSKAKRSGLIVTGRTASKVKEIINIDANNTNLVTDELNIAGNVEEPAEPQPGGEPQPTQPKKVFSISGGQVEVASGITMVGDVEKKVEAEILAEADFTVGDKVETINYREIDGQDFMQGIDNVKLMAIYADGAYVPKTDENFILFDEAGFITKQHSQAAVVLELDQKEPHVYIRPLKPMNKTIEFGLMDGNNTSEPYQFKKLTAKIDAKTGLPFVLGEPENGKMIVKGELFYGERVELTAEPNPGYVFKDWGINALNTNPYRVDVSIHYKPLTAQFAAAKLYVKAASVDGQNGGNDINSGFSEDEPLASIGGAINRIRSSNSKTNWTIEVIGEVTGAQVIADGFETPIPADTIIITGQSASKDGSKGVLKGGWDGETDIEDITGEDDGETQYSVLSVKTVVPIVIENLKITQGCALAGGGVYLYEKANVTIADGAEITENTASFGGGVYAFGDEDEELGASVTITEGAAITDNKAGTGGGVFVYCFSKLYMTGGVIDKNYAGEGGGICGTARNLVVIGGSAVIGDVTITDASKIGDNLFGNKAMYGGGIKAHGDLYIGYKLQDGETELAGFNADKEYNIEKDENSSVAIQGNYSASESGSAYGGICYTYNEPDSRGIFKMNKTTVSYNRSESEDYSADGSGVYLLNSGTNEIEDCSIIGNYCNNLGAGLCVVSPKVTVSNTDISQNVMGSSSAYGGGVLVWENCELEMRNSQVHDNQSAGGGAGIMVYGKLYAEDCQIYGNKAGQEGGGIRGTSNSIIAMAGNTVVGDADATHAPTQAEANAAGFKGNVSGNYGGAGIYSTGTLYLGHKPDATYTSFSTDANYSVKIIGNYSGGANDCGGGICDNNNIDEPGSISLYMYNTEVSHNAAASDGNGIYMKIGDITIEGSTTITNNDVYLPAGKGIYVDKPFYVPDDENAVAVEISLPSSVTSGTILTTDPYSNFDLTNVAKHFAINKVGYGLEVPGTATNKANLAQTNSVFYVKTKPETATYTPDGSLNTPFETIADAVATLNHPMVSYEIKIIGELVGDQVISDPSETEKIKARKIIISGYESDATLNGNNSKNSPGSVLTVKDTKTKVEIQNLKITGGYAAGENGSRNYKGGGIYIGENCKVTLGSGAVVTGNSADKDDDYDGYGGGVYVGKGAEFVINSGAKVFDNTVNLYGGGVYVDEGACMIMNGGEISDNKVNVSYGNDAYGGLGVYVNNATFTMNGGEISNHAGYSQHCGAVRLAGKSTFNMSGGAIESNTINGQYGANVYASGEGLIINISGDAEIKNGTIESNFIIGGAGIFLQGSGSVLNMSGGKITGNHLSVRDHAHASGAGVYLMRDTKFVMTGGEISNNTAVASGSYASVLGGVAVYCEPNGQKYEWQDPDTSEPPTVEIGGDAYIPLGDAGKNDFYLCKDGTIDIISNLTKDDAVTITPENFTDGIQLLTGLVADNLSKISLLKDECSFWKIDDDGKLSGKMPDEISLGCAPAIINGATGEIKIAIEETEVLHAALYDLYQALFNSDDIRVSLDLSKVTVCEPNNDYGANNNFSSRFYMCSRLKEVTMPKYKDKDGNSYTAIAETMFGDCENLTTVTIPATITQINRDAFAGCTSLTTVYFGGTSEQKAALLENIADGNDYLKNADWICTGD